MRRCEPRTGSDRCSPQGGTWLDSWRGLPRAWRRVFVLLTGGTTLLVGVLMVVLPGPAILVIPAGLLLLATEFMWARRWIIRLGRRFPTIGRQLRRNRVRSTKTTDCPR